MILRPQNHEEPGRVDACVRLCMPVLIMIARTDVVASSLNANQEDV